MAHYPMMTVSCCFGVLQVTLFQVQTKVNAMQHLVAKCPKGNLGCMAFNYHCYGAQAVKWVCCIISIFEKHLKPMVGPSNSEKAESHSLLSKQQPMMDNCPSACTLS